MDELVTGLVIKVTTEKCILWEDHLKLYIKPKPNYIPQKLWEYILNLVLYCTKEEK
jgi:hypothetical protein